MYTGPNVTNDDLVFGYDTGYGVADNTTVTRFYPGEPTTNVLTTANASTTASWGASNTGSTTGAVTFLVEDGMPFMRLNNVTYVSGYPRFTGQVFANSATVTGGFSTSFEARGTTGASLKLKIYDNGSTKITNTATLTDTWTRYTFDNQSTSHNLNQPYFNPNTSNAIYDIRNVQIEAKSHSTPFVSGSRSNTASLIDLKQTRDINVSNISFEGTGQPDFDGTDDFIAITDLLASQSIGLGTQLTISLWLNPDSHTSAMAFSTGQSGNDRIYFWTENGLNTWRVNAYTSTTGHGSLPSIGNWFNTVLVINGLNITVYLNGVEDYTGTYTAFTTQNYATFGRHGAASSYYYNGNIAVARIYEKALSATEVLKDFNAYKKRFNI
jgi:hypothetical protein